MSCDGVRYTMWGMRRAMCDGRQTAGAWSMSVGNGRCAAGAWSMSIGGKLRQISTDAISRARLYCEKRNNSLTNRHKYVIVRIICNIHTIQVRFARCGAGYQWYPPERQKRQVLSELQIDGIKFANYKERNFIMTKEEIYAKLPPTHCSDTCYKCCTT